MNSTNNENKEPTVTALIKEFGKKSSARPKTLTPYEILALEDLVSSLVLSKSISKYSDKQLADELHLKVELKRDDEMPNNAVAILAPSHDSEYNAVIKVRKRETIVRHFLLKEIATYLLNVQPDGSIAESFVRYKKEEYTRATARRDCLIRILLIPRSDAIRIVRGKKKDEKTYDSPLIEKYAKEREIPTTIVKERLRDVRKTVAVGSYVELKCIVKRASFLPTVNRVLEKFEQERTSANK